MSEMSKRNNFFKTANSDDLDFPWPRGFHRYCKLLHGFALVLSFPSSVPLESHAINKKPKRYAEQKMGLTVNVNTIRVT